MNIAISTHAPLAGRDGVTWQATEEDYISTHAPLAGRDDVAPVVHAQWIISTHAPLAGRDDTKWFHDYIYKNFNPRAPCGARRDNGCASDRPAEFQPTRPLRGATSDRGREEQLRIFQPTRPLRGATSRVTVGCRHVEISTHAPLAGRDDFALL